MNFPFLSRLFLSSTHYGQRKQKEKGKKKPFYYSVKDVHMILRLGFVFGRVCFSSLESFSIKMAIFFDTSTYCTSM